MPTVQPFPAGGYRYHRPRNAVLQVRIHLPPPASLVRTWLRIALMRTAVEKSATVAAG